MEELKDYDPGPFAPMIGYAGAILATVYLLLTMWRGKKQIWHSGSILLIDAAMKVTGVLAATGIVLLFINASPKAIQSLVGLAIYSGVIFFIAFLGYVFLISSLKMVKEKAVSKTKTVEEETIGGLWLTKDAKRRIAKNNITKQDLFRAAGYDKGKLWSAESQSTAMVLLVFLYVCIMFFGTVGIGNLGFIVQVKLTNKAVFETLDVKDAPGLK